jgi:hypothetical protein
MARQLKVSVRQRVQYPLLAIVLPGREPAPWNLIRIHRPLRLCLT